jgi:hypothetical protein
MYAAYFSGVISKTRASFSNEAASANSSRLTSASPRTLTPATRRINAALSRSRNASIDFIVVSVTQQWE